MYVIIGAIALACYMIGTAMLSGASWTLAHKLNKRGATDDKGNDLGGVMPFSLTWAPEVLFALPFAIAPAWAAHALFDTVVIWQGVIAVVAGNISYWSMQNGHGVVLPWGKPVLDPDEYEKTRVRTQGLTPVVNWFARRLDVPIDGPDGLRSVQYCRLFMAVKGFTIGFPVGGFPLAILWPTSYEIGERVEKHAVSEGLSGLSAAIQLIIFIAVITLLKNYVQG